MRIYPEEYLLMCACEEVQSRWRPLPGQTIYSQKTGSCTVIHTPVDDRVLSTHAGMLKRAGCVWIPNVYDYVSMFNVNQISTYRTLGIVMNSCTEYDQYCIEAMFLIAFMKHIHNKKWEGGSWQASQ